MWANTQQTFEKSGNFRRQPRVTAMNEISAKQVDDQLIELTLAGDREAFGGLVRRYQDRLYNGMVQILRNETEAEDTVQEAFILALTKLHTFQGRSGFFTWLFRIAYNVAVTRMRQRKPTVSISGTVSDFELSLPATEPMPDAGILQRERAEQLMQALDQISAEHRAILVLREMDGMDYSAIAEILDLPIGTVRSRLHRARLQLKELLETMFEG